jgi:hypothetical protein
MVRRIRLLDRRGHPHRVRTDLRRTRAPTWPAGGSPEAWPYRGVPTGRLQCCSSDFECYRVSPCVAGSDEPTEWAHANGVHPQTARKWFREGNLPVPATRVGPRTILVNVEANSTPATAEDVGLYSRVSSHDQKADLERQTARLTRWAAQENHRVVRVEAEVGSGMNGARTKARRLLSARQLRSWSWSTGTGWGA